MLTSFKFEKPLPYLARLSRRNLSDVDKIEAALVMEGIFKAQAKERQLNGLKQGDKMPVPQINGEREETPYRREVNSRIGDLAGTGRAKVEAVRNGIRKTIVLPSPRSAAPHPDGKGGQGGVLLTQKSEEANEEEDQSSRFRNSQLVTTPRRRWK